jgi:alkylation response protein AidB-like acyl-CoA dehydrogenase
MGARTWSFTPYSRFDLYTLPDEHRQLRGIVRLLVEMEIEPYAAHVDEESRFPRQACWTLTAAGFHAPTFRQPMAAKAPTRWRRASSSRRSPACARRRH